MQAKAREATLEGQLSAIAPRMALSALILGLFAYLLQDRIAAFEPAAAMAQVQALQTWQWLGAVLATGISFWAMGRYDAAMHQHMETGVAGAQAQRAGITAIAISQTVGAGVITGALVRWRMLPSVSLWQATRLSVAVTLSFLAGWAVVTGATLTVFSAGALWLIGAGMCTLGGVVFMLGAAQPYALRWMQLPNALVQARLFGLTAVDTLAACMALYLFIPESAGLGFTALLPAFLLALGAGLASGTPGGIGAFEVSLLALLPDVPEASLLAAILGWRMVYYAVPAVLAAGVALIGPGQSLQTMSMRKLPLAEQDSVIGKADRAEFGLAHQGHLAIMQDAAGTCWAVGHAGHCRIGMFDPVGASDLAAALTRFADAARHAGQVPAIYKCTSQIALTARRLGWPVIALASEAVLDPAQFSLEGPAMAALRRKLRKAESAGITLQVARAMGAAERAAIARLWARARKGERGFSMGRYDEAYLARQLVIEARVDGVLVAFASFHQGAQEWTLDLMRQQARSPDGTMHAIVTHAIALARAAGITRLSLASAGVPPAIRRFHKGDAGLVQFKQMFAPRWQPLYMAAPTMPQLMLAAAEVTRAIHRPPPLEHLTAPQDHLAQNEIAHGPQAWQMSA